MGKKKLRSAARRGLSLLLTLTMCLSLLQVSVFADPSGEDIKTTEDGVKYTVGSRSVYEGVADPATATDNPNLETGQVWTDKSVTYNDDGESFNIDLSALASTEVVKEVTSEAVDVMLILDMSQTMTSNSVTYDGERVTRLEAMRRAVNGFLSRILKNGGDPNTRVGITTFSYDAHVILPLAHYDSASLDAITVNGRKGVQAYADGGVVRGKDDDMYSTTGSDYSKPGANIQAGLFRGMQEVSNNIDDDHKNNIPYIILLTDGQPAHANGIADRVDGNQISLSGNWPLGDYAYNGNDTRLRYDSGKTDGWCANADVPGGDDYGWSKTDPKSNKASVSDSDVISAMKALLTASYMKKEIAGKYNAEPQVFTVGVDLSKETGSNTATYDNDTIYPKSSLGPTFAELSDVMLNPKKYLDRSYEDSAKMEETDLDKLLSNPAAYRIAMAWRTYTRYHDETTGTAKEYEGNEPINAVLSVPSAGAHWGYQINYTIKSPQELGAKINNIDNLCYADKSYLVNDLNEINNAFDQIVQEMNGTAENVIKEDSSGSGIIFTDIIPAGMEIDPGSISVTYDGKKRGGIGLNKVDAEGYYTVDIGRNDYRIGLVGKSDTPDYPSLDSGVNKGDAKINMISVKVSEGDNGSHIVTVTIPAGAVPHCIKTFTEVNGLKDEGTFFNRPPMKVSYKVKKTENANVGEEGLYTNSKNDGDVKAVFTPTEDNPYYPKEGYAGETKNKTMNQTGTLGFSSSETKKDSQIEVKLGNNGKLTKEDIPYVQKFTLFKKTENNEPISGAVFELRDSDNKTVSSATSGADGSVTFGNDGVKFEAGAYTVYETKAAEGFVTPDANKPVATVVVGVDENNKATLTVKDTELHLYANGVITNKRDPRNKTVTVTKYWVGDDNTTNNRSLTVTLTAKNKEIEPIKIDDEWEKNGDTWTAEVTVPTVDVESGNPINWEATESGCPGNYSPVGDTTKTVENNTVFFTNKLDTRDITVTKKWIAPESMKADVDVVLKENKVGGKEYKKTIPNGTPSVTFGNLPVKDEDGNPIQYTIEELTKLPGFKPAEIDPNDYTITNTVEQKNFSINGTKIWKGDPTSGEVTLTGTVDGEEVITKTTNLTGDGYNYFVFNDVPRYDVQVREDGEPDTGKEIVYQVSDNIEGFTSELVEVNINGENDNVDVTLTNTRNDINEKISVSATKIWKDDNNAYNTRPESAELTLQKLVAGKWEDVKDESKDVLGKTGKTITRKITRKEPIDEQDVIDEVGGDGPDSEIVGGSDEEDNDSGAEKSNPADEIQGADDESNPADEDQGNDEPQENDEISAINETGEPRTITETIEEPVWTSEINVTFDNLPKYDANGAEIWYRVVEKDEPEGYARTSGRDLLENKFIITNTLKGVESTITVNKIWVDADNTERSKATVTLTGSNGETKDVTFDGSTNTQTQDVPVPVYKDGNKITWNAKESVVSVGYTSDMIEDANGFTFRNTINQVAKEVTVKKNWEDELADPSKRPNITLTLYRTSNLSDKEQVGKPANGDTLAADGTYTWNNLDTYDFKDGQCAVWNYTVKETMDGELSDRYTSSYSDDGLTVTNTFNAETTTVSGSKTWTKPGNVAPTPEEIAAAKFTVEGKVGETTVYTKEVSLNNDGKIFTATDLPKYDVKTGEEITYTVEESTVPTGFTSYDLGDNNFNNRSNELEGKVTLTVYKIWKGPEAERPESIEVELYANGKPTDDKLTLNATDGWYGEKSLPKYDDDNNEIDWTVKETGQEGDKITINNLIYDVAIAPDATNPMTFSITNTLSEDDNKDKLTVSVAGEKKWSPDGTYEPDEDFEYPEITVRLLADGEETENVATLNKDNWKYEWTGLPKYATDSDYHEISYTMKEDGADPDGRIRFDQGKGSYLFVVSGGTKDDGYDITNRYHETEKYVYRVVAYYVTNYTYSGREEISPQMVLLDNVIGEKDKTYNAGTGEDFTHDVSAWTSYGNENYTYFVNEEPDEGYAKTNEEVTLTKVNAPDEHTIVLWYQRSVNDTPYSPSVNPTQSYTVTVNYYDKDTNAQIAQSFSQSGSRNTSYNVTDRNAIAIEGYTYVETTGDSLTGTLDSNKVINVYYTRDETDIQDEPVPEGPGPGDSGSDDDPTDIPDVTPPLSDNPGNNSTGSTTPTIIQNINTPGSGSSSTRYITEERVPSSSSANVDIFDNAVPLGDTPQTGDESGMLFWMIVLTLSGIGLVILGAQYRKKKTTD